MNAAGHEMERPVDIQIVEVVTADDLEAARVLFVEYASSLSFSLCFQGFNDELATLPGRYEAPRGRMLLAKIDGWAVGCIAMRPVDEARCEMKRLYVRPWGRGLGLGRRMIDTLVSIARAEGYAIMQLDTAREMATARALYESVGFVTVRREMLGHPAAITDMERRLDTGADAGAL